MEKLKIVKANAIVAHQSADKNGKKLLEDLFGAEVFILPKIEDRVTSYETACEVLGIDEDEELLERLPEHLSAQFQLEIIIKALNEGWVPDWTDSSQYKYLPYFNNYKPGFGFSCNVYGGWNSVTFVGSRLFLKSGELAEVVGKRFIDLYNKSLIIS